MIKKVVFTNNFTYFQNIWPYDQAVPQNTGKPFWKKPKDWSTNNILSTIKDSKFCCCLEVKISRLRKFFSKWVFTILSEACIWLWKLHHLVYKKYQEWKGPLQIISIILALSISDRCSIQFYTGYSRIYFWSLHAKMYSLSSYASIKQNVRYWTTDIVLVYNLTCSEITVISLTMDSYFLLAWVCGKVRHFPMVWCQIYTQPRSSVLFKIDIERDFMIDKTAMR